MDGGQGKNRLVVSGRTRLVIGMSRKGKESEPIDRMRYSRGRYPVQGPSLEQNTLAFQGQRSKCRYYISKRSFCGRTKGVDFQGEKSQGKRWSQGISRRKSGNKQKKTREKAEVREEKQGRKRGKCDSLAFPFQPAVYDRNRWPFLHSDPVSL